MITRQQMCSIVQRYFSVNHYSNKRRWRAMYTYRVDKDTTNKVVSLANKESNKMSKLIDEINDYNKVFDTTDFSSVPSSKNNLERMKDVEIDSDKIKSQAEGELADYKNTQENKIKDEIDKEAENLTKEKTAVNKNYETAKANVKSSYDSAKEDASQDALRRGLSRSSIVVNVLDAFDKEKLSKYNQLNEELTTRLNEIDADINGLSAKRDKALSDFDISYAVKLQDRINSLTSELEKKQNEVLKYNNEIAVKEDEYNRKYADMVQEIKNKNWSKEKDLLELANKYGYDSVAKYKNSQIVDKAKKFFQSYDKQEIIDELRNNQELIDTLGKDAVDKLLKYYQS